MHSRELEMHCKGLKIHFCNFKERGKEINWKKLEMSWEGLEIHLKTPSLDAVKARKELGVTGNSCVSSLSRGARKDCEHVGIEN